jgi:hypothetical protein
MNCVVGDMAVIKAAPGVLEENVGSFVTVKHPCGVDPKVGPLWLVLGALDLLGIDGNLSRVGIISDRALHPIRPQKPQQEIKTAAPITEVIPA